jgi:head-tail adaptor
MGDYKKKNGTTRVGDFLRSINFSKALDVVAKLTSGDVSGAIKELSENSNELTQEQREVALELVKLDMKAQEDVTNRWRYDMESDNWLSKNVRPLALIFLTVATVLIAISDSMNWNFNVDNSWIDLLKTLLITVYTAYFAGRSFEKYRKL